MKTFAISDIHGAYKALIQVLERCEFDPEVDRLIFLGDIVDGYESGITECIEYLSKLPNLVQVLGNHDDWCLRWLNRRAGKALWGLGSDEFKSWTSQGGQATINSMDKHESYVLVREFLDKSVYYHEEDNKLFVHGGIKCDTEAKYNPPDSILWNRSMIERARGAAMSQEDVCTMYDEVYCGHTPVVFYECFEPMRWSNVWAIDCGASYPNYDGRLGVVNINTKQIWVSDLVKELYPNEKAR